MIELPKESYSDVRPLFLNFRFHLSIISAIERTIRGRIWVDNQQTPKSALLIFGDGYVLVGDSNGVQFIKDLREFFLDIINNAKNPPPFTDDAIWLHTTDDWLTRLKDIFPTRKPRKVQRVHYICENLEFDWKEALPEDCRIVRVDENFQSHNLSFAKGVGEWVDSEWLEENIKQGFGSCMVKENEIISWGSADCYSDEDCEIGIFVEPKYRRRGFGVITAAAAVDFAFERGFKRIGWHTEADDHGSIGVAKKMGFTKEKTIMSMCVCLMKDTNDVLGLSEMFFR